MAREIINSIIQFDWGIAIPFFIFTVAVYAIIKEVNADIHNQNHVLKKSEKGTSRYE